MIKAALFDMDGLMFDTEPAYTIVHAAMWNRRGKKFTPEIKTSLMGKRAEEVMRTILSEHWKTDEKIEDLLKEQDDELSKIFRESVAKMPGLDVCLSLFDQKNIRTCIGTSSRKFLADILLEYHDLSDKFEFIVSGEMVARGKPDPEVYLTCADRLGLRPEECLVLEDSPNGIRAGHAAGCFTCAIPSEYAKGGDFSAADIICKTLADTKLRNIIEEKFFSGLKSDIDKQTLL